MNAFEDIPGEQPSSVPAEIAALAQLGPTNLARGKPATSPKLAAAKKSKKLGYAGKSRKKIMAAAAVAAATEAGESVKNEDLPPLPPLAPFQGSIVQISPNLIEPWEHAIDRTEFLEPDSYKLVYESIELAGTNSEPILVRKILQPLQGGPQYTLITGQLRLRACQELKLNVQAQVEEAKGFDDYAALRHMFNSNRGRQSYAPAALGRWGERMLEIGVFPTARVLCHTCGYDEGDFSKARKVAALPREVLEAFRHTSGPHFRHAVPLAELQQSDREGLLMRAAVVAKKNRDENFAMKPREIYEALLPPKSEVSKNPGSTSKKCADCMARAQALLMTSPFAVQTALPVNTASMPQGASASVGTALHQLEAERPAKTQLQLDLGTGTELVAPSAAGSRIETDESGSQGETYEPVAPESVRAPFVLPTYVPSDAEPIVTDADAMQGWVFDDLARETCGVFRVSKPGKPYRKWLALRLSILLSNIPDFDDVGSEASGGPSA